MQFLVLKKPTCTVFPAAHSPQFCLAVGMCDYFVAGMRHSVGIRGKIRVGNSSKTLFKICVLQEKVLEKIEKPYKREPILLEI